MASYAASPLQISPPGLDTVGKILAKHTGHSLEEVLSKTATDSYFNATEAVAWGLAETVYPRPSRTGPICAQRLPLVSVITRLSPDCKRLGST